VRNGAKLDLTVNTSTPAAADRLLAEYRKFEAKASESMTEAERADTAAATTIDKLDSGLRLRIAATQSQMTPGLSKLYAGFGIPWTPPVERPVEQRKTIIIDGLK
ncbi:MAG: hypothetical protein ACREUU_09120, partial [Gammaproteobacteria bacterium]